jgi:aminomethyltransferase
MLKLTPFHPRTAQLNASQAWRRWAGYVAASSYELTHDHEYHAIRNSAALLDVTPLYKYWISGEHATELLHRVVTRNVAKMKVGQVAYTPWCDSAGKVLDDGTISRLGETTYRLTSADPNLRWLSENAIGLNVEIDDISESTAALSLQGPTSRDILEHATESSLHDLKYFRLIDKNIRGLPVTISRTGYTGDLGYEIWLDAELALPLWDALTEVGSCYGMTPTGLIALDMARIEAGLILLDVDYISARKALIERQKSSPFEINLKWTVDLEKDYFVGRDALAAEAAQGPEWQFVGVEVDWDSLESLYNEVGLAPRLPTMAWRVSVPLYDGGEQIGYATSGSWSPLLKKYIALAHVTSKYAAPGTELEMEITVEHHRERARARIAALPFFNPERKRA